MEVLERLYIDNLNKKPDPVVIQVPRPPPPKATDRPGNSDKKEYKEIASAPIAPAPRRLNRTNHNSVDVGIIDDIRTTD